jgi:Ca2+-binding EF-hand superfamily protein
MALNGDKPIGSIFFGESNMKSNLLSALIASFVITGSALAQSSPASAPTPDRAAQMQQRFDQHFSKLDKNGDGFVDHDEAAGNKRLSAHFDQVDANKDGKISKDEMKASFAASHAKRHERREKYAAKFKAADKDGDGALSKEEAQAAKMSHIVKNFDAIDSNKDGKVTPAELHAAMRSQHRARAAQ